MKIVTVWTCEVRTTTLECGCVEIDKLEAVDEPKDSEMKCQKCQRCGKYHYHAQPEMQYRDCPTHTDFFRKWPGVNRCYISNQCPQLIGFDAHDASGLLRDGQWPERQKWELIRAITKSARKNAGCYAYLATLYPKANLSQAMRDALALRVDKAYWARRFLQEVPGISNHAQRHLQWVLAKPQIVLWAMRSMALVLAIAVWRWHLPDWRSIVVLATTAACATAAVRIKDWLE